ncbi:hypothetical protein WSS_A24990 [Rhodococcus opacus M213]|uniref:Uncharacterized protein n=1 Tax=Rhodococcus opacus M213 TaxID=1129896 RepID=K8XEA5_RHOOP|nr:hypothetical protein [Rhodococcus opacus]EKT79893.1 hypothetical protein WSS_A24990 [Rhodococcus opacus M213]
MGGVTYGISQTRFEATRELLARFAEGHTLGVAMSLTHDGARHHLYITPGVPITLVERRLRGGRVMTVSCADGPGSVSGDVATSARRCPRGR